MSKTYIDIHNQDKYYENKLRKIQRDKNLSATNKKLILQYLRDSELGKTIKKGQRRKIGAGRNLQAASILMLMSKEWFKKDLDKVIVKDMEGFILDLDRGRIKSNRGKPYASEMKSNIKKFIRKFYKVILGNGYQYPELVDWIDTSKVQAEVHAIPGLKEGVWRIVELIPDVRRKALVWVAFDSGFREGELINCRVRDVEKGEDGVYFLTCRHSKTKPRTVSLPYSSELLDRWLEEHPHKDDPEAQLWQTSRPMFYKTVKRYARKAFKQSRGPDFNVTVHMLRHTSATFWGPKLDRVNFCKRFGWSYNSDSPDRYLDYAKVSQKQTNQVVRNERLHALSEELENQKARNSQLSQEVEELRRLQLKIIKNLKLQNLADLQGI